MRKTMRALMIRFCVNEKVLMNLLLQQQSENQEYHKAQVEGMSVVMEKVQ